VTKDQESKYNRQHIL